MSNIQNIDTAEYSHFLSEVIQHISSSQIKVSKAVNTGINELYWEIGKLIHEKQKHHK